MTLAENTIASKDAVQCALDLITRVEASIYDFERFVRENATNPDLLVACAETAYEAEKVMKSAHDDAERLLLELLGRKKSLKLRNGDVVRKEPQFREVCDETRMRLALSDIVLQHSFSPKTGEIKLNPDFAIEVVELVLAVLKKATPRKQALKAHRINPATIYSELPADPKLVLVPAPGKVSQGVVTMKRGGGAK